MSQNNIATTCGTDFLSHKHTHAQAIPYQFYLIRNKKEQPKTTSVFVQQIKRKLWVIYTINKHVQTIKVMWYLGFSIYQSINTILTIMLLEFYRLSPHKCYSDAGRNIILVTLFCRFSFEDVFLNDFIYISWFRSHVVWVKANCFELKKKKWALKLCSNDLKWPPLKRHFIHTHKIYFIVFMTEYKICNSTEPFAIIKIYWYLFLNSYWREKNDSISARQTQFAFNNIKKKSSISFFQHCRANIPLAAMKN